MPLFNNVLAKYLFSYLFFLKQLVKGSTPKHADRGATLIIIYCKGMHQGLYCDVMVSTEVKLPVQISAGPFLHVLPKHTWVLSGYSSFLPQSKNMLFRLMGDSKLIVGVSWPCHGTVLCLSPDCGWDGLQLPREPELDNAGIENGWMDRTVAFFFLDRQGAALVLIWACVCRRL